MTVEGWRKSTLFLSLLLYRIVNLLFIINSVALVTFH
jgi:hypothetical protein